MFLQHSFYNKRLGSEKKSINIRLTVITEADLHHLSYPKYPFFHTPVFIYVRPPVTI